MDLMDREVTQDLKGCLEFQVKEVVMAGQDQEEVEVLLVKVGEMESLDHQEMPVPQDLKDHLGQVEF